MEDTESNISDEDNQLPRAEVLPLIISQLQHYGLNSIAAVVAEESNTPYAFDPSPQLAELCYQGKVGRDNDDAEEIVPADLTEEISDEESTEAEESSWADAKGQAPTTPPNLAVWFSTQHREACRTAVFSADGKYLATGSEDTTMKVLDVSRIKAAFRDGAQEKPVIRTLYDHMAPVNDVHFHPNGTVLASCSHDQTIKLFDIQMPNVKRSFRYLQDANVVRSIHFHPSGDYIAAGTDHEAVRIFDVHSLKCFSAAASKESHTGAINKIRYAPSGKFFATAGDDGSIKMWDTVSGQCVKTISQAHSGRPVTSVRFTRSGRYLLSCGLDSVGKLWDMHTGNAVQEFVGASQKDVYTTNTFNYNEDYVLGTDEKDWAIVMWDSRTGALLKKTPAHMAPLRCIAASPVENTFVTCSDDYRAKFWGER
ncbi:WD40-repeat-containing domain protein [Fimicolochytrium jonesii]|uniref:WD40-repeat-containing domain protein n=1 Tax=Fimicolochytrium jonesii TaxID=1396493 RepID=UPI0022FE7926|nr:WD40-repeat-containing domain protein [Fimicolochytrium jonesii]KAI8822120.1 WD40-repeat-containing domain protein [Fimicolochytrium jonesii]